MSENRIKERQKALLDAIESMDKGNVEADVVPETSEIMVGDVVRRLVDSYIAEQREHIVLLVKEVKKLDPKWQPSQDIAECIEMEIDQERALGQ